MIGKTNKKAYSAIKISKLGSIAAMTQGMVYGAFSDGNFMRMMNITVPIP
jgi:hypothetical protein